VVPTTRMVHPPTHMHTHTHAHARSICLRAIAPTPLSPRLRLPFPHPQYLTACRWLMASHPAVLPDIPSFVGLPLLLPAFPGPSSVLVGCPQGRLAGARCSFGIALQALSSWLLSPIGSPLSPGLSPSWPPSLNLLHSSAPATLMRWFFLDFTFVSVNFVP
jgi:hypothetical protein